MALPDLLTRPLVAGIFVIGGLDALRNPASKVEAARKLAGPLSQKTGLDAEQLVRVNGAVQVAAGVALATNVLARPAALALAATLVPATLAGHRFWEERDEMAKKMHRIHFLKNASIFGGLLAIARSTGGRPSLPWRARRAVGSAVDASVDTVQKLIPT